MAAVAVAALSAVVPSAAAQDSPADRAQTVSRTASAGATVVRIVPTIGSLDVGIDIGSAASEVENHLAQSQAATINAGLLPVLFTAGECPALEPLAAGGEAIIPTRAESRNGDQRAVNDHGLPPGSVVAASSEEASAIADPPSATATTQTSVSLPGVLDLTAASARTTAAVLEDGTYRAHASVEADLRLAGTVDLAGLRWTAEHIDDGGDGVGHAEFSIGSATVAGATMPVDDLAALGVALNQALNLVGITLDLPTVTTMPGTGGGSTVGPLRITFHAPAESNTLLGTIIDPLGATLSPLPDLLRQVSCALGPALLGSDLVLTIARGNGSIALEIGGASAASGTHVFESPFGPDTTPIAAAPSPSSSDPLPSTATSPGAVQESAALQPPAPAQDRLLAASIATRCSTLHPFGHPTCRSGDGALVGVLGLVTVAGLAALDVRRQRRALRSGAPS